MNGFCLVFGCRSVNAEVTKLPLGKVLVRADEYAVMQEQARAFCVNRDELENVRKRKREAEELREYVIEQRKRLATENIKVHEAYNKQLTLNRHCERLENELKAEKEKTAVLQTDGVSKAERIAALEEICRGAYESLANVTAAVRALKIGDEYGRYRIDNPTEEQERLINAITEYSSYWAKTEVFPTLRLK